MHKISITFNPAEYKTLTLLARRHGGNLSAAARSLLHQEVVTKSLADSVDVQIKAALAPVLEVVNQVLEAQASEAVAFKELKTILKKLIDTWVAKKY